MAALPRTECPACSRDVAVSPKGRVWRHDPASGRDPELRSCEGSLKPVAPPAGQALLFVSLEETLAAAGLPEAPEMPEPVRLF
ncbi:hypothetical protein [Streptomyces nitrosporeus]|uniref:hypothetical protein n=1 Tax=Streptomyces nitrosporeus TaxID=28894 RepID=UPI00167D70B8|nr:hypothetical protein [Streptomyces nitrosporeus]GGZ27902.1 hypothetical protein GCM10010327_67910 [Streptomyces nitrosporeus]